MKTQTPCRWFAATLLLVSSFCRAQTGERVVYDAAFYAAFSPRTALDMVKQTPGFVLAEQDQELRRGFSGAVGNVLIDGERLSAKSQTLDDVLQRVPAREVLRIEILRGSAVAGDASGATVLANVVRTPSTGGGAWGLGMEMAERAPAPNGWFAWGGRRGVTEYSLGGNTYSLNRDLPGERSLYDGAGNIDERRFENSPRDFSEYALNGQVARPLAGGRLSLTGQLSYSRYHDDSTLLTTTTSGVQVEDQDIPYTESDRVGEFGANYQRSFESWELDLDALLTLKRHRSHVSATRFDGNGALDSVFTQDLERNSAEGILRAALGREVNRGRIEVGAEFAVNTLTGSSHLTFDDGGGPAVISVPNDNLQVEENRAEAFVGHTLPLGVHWSLEARLAAEGSRLDFSGDTDQSVSLSYLKPRLRLTRALGAHQLQLLLFRDVGQLDFTDFVSSVEVADEFIDGGNPDLKPQTAWAAEVIGDIRLTDATAMRVRLFHHWLDDVADLVPVGIDDDRFDAPGNIGRGSLDGAEITLRTPVRALPGGSFNLSGTLQRARVADPVTHERRSISGLVERHVKAEFRQDLQAARFTWGASFTGQSATTTWRLNETDRKGKSSSLDLFAETGAFRGFKLRLTLVSALGDFETRTRRYFLPARTGMLVGSELGQRRPGHWWLLTISGGF